MSAELKPCPFCGKQPVRDCLPSGKVWCGVHTTAMREAHWNTRAEPESDWTIPLRRHVPEIKAELKSCDGCDTDDYDIHTCGKGTRSDLKPRRCNEHDFQCYKCGVATEVNIALNTQLQTVIAMNEQGQRALELLREWPKVKGVLFSGSDSRTEDDWNRDREALLEASDEQHPKP